MRALLIDVGLQVIREVHLKPDETESICKQIVACIGPPCTMFTHVNLGDGVDLWVDDEGLLQGRTRGFRFKGPNRILMGNGLLTCTGPDGETVALKDKYTSEVVAPLVEFIVYDDPNQAPQPKIEIIPLEGFDAEDKE